MIIILEGTEGGCKTTVAEKISAQTGWPIEHRSKPETELERQQMYEDYKQSILSRRNLIWDRCWYSEMVYGPIMRDQSYINQEQMYEFEQLLVENGGAILVHCTDNIEIQWARATARGEEYVTDKDTFDKLHLRYNVLMHGITHLIPVVRYEASKNPSLF